MGNQRNQKRRQLQKRADKGFTLASTVPERRPKCAEKTLNDTNRGKIFPQRFLIPTKRQWAEWGLLSKVGWLGGWASIIGLPLAFIFFLLSLPTDAKEPVFRPYVNGLAITNSRSNLHNDPLGTNICYITIPVTDDFGRLEFWMENTRKTSANGFQLSVAFPQNITATGSQNWERVTASDAANNFFKGPCFRFTSKETLGQSNVFVIADPIEIRTDHFRNSLNQITMRVDSTSCEPRFFPIFIHFANGAGPAHYGL